MGKKKSKKADESETEQKAKSKSGSKPKSSKTRQRSPSVAPPPEERRQSSRQKANKVAPIPTTKDTSKPSRKRANSEAAEGPSEHKNKKPKKPDGTRRIPSAIPAEDSDISMEDLAEKSQAPFQPPKKNVKVLEDFPTEDDKLTEEEDNDNMVEQSKEHDLTLLSKSKLKDTLSAERPSWGQSQHLGANAKSKSEVLQKNTKDDNKKQNRKKKASSSGTSSESDSSSSDSTNSDSTNSDSSGLDSESSSSEKEATKPTLSKRAKNRLEEVPQWKPTKEQATKKSCTRSKSQKPKPDTGSDNEAPHPDNAKKAALLHINQGWHRDAHYVPPSKPSSPIPVMEQPPVCFAVLKAGNEAAVGDALFKSAYPPALTQPAYLREMAIQITRDFELPKFRKRLREDPQLLKLVSNHLMSKVGRVHSDCRAKVAPNAGAHYHLEGKDPAFVKARVAELLKGDYIYPSSENGTPLKSRPYHHPAFIATLRDLYFTSPRRAVAVRYAGRFTSVIKEGHGTGREATVDR